MIYGKNPIMTVMSKPVDSINDFINDINKDKINNINNNVLSEYVHYWDIIIKASIDVCKGTPIISIRKGKENVLQLCLMTELNNLNYKIRKEFPFSPVYRDAEGNCCEVGDRTSLAPDISILFPFKCIIECKHGLSPEAVYQLMVYLDHMEDYDMGCTIEWYIDKDEKVMITSTLLVKNKSIIGSYYKHTITHDTGIVRTSKFIEI